MKNTVLKILVAALVLVAVLSISKDMVIKIGVEKGVQVVTGLPLGIKSFRVGVLSTKVDIDGLKLYNPKGFEDRIMLDMPDIYVDYDLPEILAGKVYLNEVRMDMKELVVVKNPDGVLNLDSLKAVSEGKQEAPAEKKEEGEMPEMRIDIMQLKIGKVVYKDYSGGGEPRVQEYVIDLDEEFRDITDPQQIVSVILLKALMNTPLGRMLQLDMSGLKDMAGGTLESARELTGKATEAAGQTASNVGESVSGVTKNAGEAVGNVFKSLPFGGDEKK